MAVSEQKATSVNDYYVTTAPCPQNAIDIFKDEWSSKFPSPLQNLKTGHAGLFDDPRVQWLITELGSLQGRQILELGPLEGGHTYLLEKAGVDSVTSIEANTRAYLKCLVTKELLGLQRAKFLCGDFVEYLKSPDCPQFDIGIASGVLYHMINPVELISLLARQCRTHLLIWTHYFDEKLVPKGLKSKFGATKAATFEGLSHTLVRYNYQAALGWGGFCGGPQPYSNWLSREDIFRSLKHFGFPNIKVNFEHPDHPNGPAFTLIAGRE